MAVKRPIEQRFWEKVDTSGDCWIWTGSLNHNGYGRLRGNAETEKNIAAHRFSWELHYGPIPPGEGYHGTCVCHKCDNKICVNPDHLFLGSHSDNIKDMHAKGRGALPANKGSENPRAKLTEPMVRMIKMMLAGGRVTQKHIAEIHGVSNSAIQLIATGKRWSHI